MSIGKSSFLFTLGTLISRVSGLLRDICIAAVFGASTYLDAFLIANRIPNLFRDLLAEGALSSSFTKTYTALSETDTERARQLLRGMLRLGGVLLILISIVGFIAAPYLVQIFTALAKDSQRGPEFFTTTINLTKLLFPFLGIAILSAIAMGALQQSGQFFLAAFSSVGLNLGYIVGALVLSPLVVRYGPAWVGEAFGEGAIVGLALGVLLGGLFHFLIQFYYIWRDVLRVGGPKARVWLSADMLDVFKLMAPYAIATSASSINLIINSNFATSLENGAVSWLNYSFHLFQLPVGLFGVAVASVALPSLTREIVRRHQVDSEVSRQLQNAIELVMWLMLPCTLILALCHHELIVLFFQHGRFDDYAAAKTSEALLAYSFGVLGYGMVKVLTSFYFAIGKTRWPMYVAMVSILVNLVANWLLVDRFGHSGLAFTTALTVSFNALILFLATRRFGFVLEVKPFLRSVLFLTLASAVVLGTLSFALPLFSSIKWGHWGKINLMALAQVVIVSLVVGLTFLVFGSVRLKRSPWDVIRQIKKRSAGN